MFKKIRDGFLYTVGAFLALNVIGFVDGQNKMYFGKKTENECRGECNCGKTEE